MSATKETVESKIKKIVENCIHSKVLKDKEPYIQYNGVVGTTYDADSYEEVITDAPDYLMDHIPGGVMMDDSGEEHDYSKDYLTTEALESGTISFKINKYLNTDMIKSISYSTDNGTTWNKTDNSDNKKINLYININVNKGDKVLWKGDAITLADSIKFYASGFESNIKINVSGNIISLLYEDNFSDKTSFPSDITSFYSLFGWGDGAKNLCDVVNAKDLILPDIILTNRCYRDMFGWCKSLVTAPELPATTLTFLCYANMFKRCTSLVNAPELPATTIADGCYIGMFSWCTSLVTAPELPATTLTQECYTQMFNGCSSLTHIEMLATDISASSCLTNWVNGVSQTGTFIKAQGADIPMGVNGIPEGWTVEEK